MAITRLTKEVKVMGAQIQANGAAIRALQSDGAVGGLEPPKLPLKKMVEFDKVNQDRALSNGLVSTMFVMKSLKL